VRLARSAARRGTDPCSLTFASWRGYTPGTWTESRSVETTAQVAACYAGPGISFTASVGSKSVTTTVVPGEIQSVTDHALGSEQLSAESTNVDRRI
jgi:hypothetical protein